VYDYEAKAAKIRLRLSRILLVEGIPHPSLGATYAPNLLPPPLNSEELSPTRGPSGGAGCDDDDGPPCHRCCCYCCCFDGAAAAVAAGFFAGASEEFGLQYDKVMYSR